jgi:hypothetical protein
MFSIIRGIWDLFWEGFIILLFFFSAQDIYYTMKKEALGKASRGIPSLLKFNDHLWGRAK